VSKSGKSIEEIMLICKNKYDDVIEEYLNFLVENELGFFCMEEELKMFPSVSLEWDSPYIFTNAIIDINKDFDYSSIVTQINEMSIKFIQVRCFHEWSLNELAKIISLFDNTISSVELLIPFNDGFTKGNILEFESI